ncbi:hypothetical protein FF011L_55000 [Roseimaritima multifibrata]|uniref:Uncharacterized protein n=1 Tax=Roseimaritima multifibrata TaxID=1930274 RepID=A0A517MP85_9BACT|nr:hypothetical protein FF011L_55000 [Roseimaritima multifibrata]
MPRQLNRVTIEAMLLQGADRPGYRACTNYRPTPFVRSPLLENLSLTLALKIEEGPAKSNQSFDLPITCSPIA